VAVDNQTWEHWLERVYNLRRDKQGSHERPHKPALLLSIIDLLDRGVILENLVPFSDELVRTFKRYFEVVRASNDTPTIENPFYFLSGDKFWQVSLRNSSEPLYREGYASAAPSVGQLRDQGVAGRFADGFWSLLSDPISRHQLREALIARYFPEKREELAGLVSQPQPHQAARPLGEELPPAPARDAAFRRMILEVYDYRCAACGMRVLLNQRISLVVAAHLIPFEVSPNDKPTNGMALCPNHHWAMGQ